ncbi:MAG: biliverdin-producing heme oxygenase [Chloroflexota bacterium]
MSRKVTTLKLLKQSTYDCHIRVENRLDLLSPGLTQERYIAILAAFYGFYAPLEAQWRRFGEQSVCRSLFQNRLKIPLLYNDLVSLKVEGSTIASFPLCSYVPQQKTFMDVLGTMYVLEGATLGGQIIMRHLSNHFDFMPKYGGTFFASYGEQVAAMWRSFTQLVGSIEQEQDIAHIVTAAVQTFDTLDQWLEERQL